MNNIIVEMNGPITEIILNRPDKKNALTPEMYSSISDALINANTSDDCKVVVIRANGDVFCAGNEIAGFADQSETPQLAETLRFMNSLLDCKKIVIAEVKGLAVGIGTTMLLHCDFVYSCSDTKFIMPFINLGLVPEYASSYILPLMAGRKRASEWLLLGEPFGAKEAYEFGMITKVVPANELTSTVDKAAGKLASKPAFALSRSKALINNQTDLIREQMDTEMDIFIEAMRTEAAREAFDAFLNKRAVDPEKFK